MKDSFVVFESQNKTVKINVHEIVAVACEGACITIHYSAELKTFKFSKSLVHIEDVLTKFDSCTWLRTNRNSIVSLNKVEILDKRNRKIIMQGGLELTVSVRQLPLVNKMIKEKLLL